MHIDQEKTYPLLSFNYIKLNRRKILIQSMRIEPILLGKIY